MTHFDKMAALSHQAFNSLAAKISESFVGRKVIAAMIMKRGEEDDGTVISVGSGKLCEFEFFFNNHCNKKKKILCQIFSPDKPRI